MNTRKLSIFIGCTMLMASALLSCDDKDKAKFEEAVRADLMQKMIDEIDKYSELDGISIASIDPFTEDNIVKDGDTYTAKTKAKLVYTYNDSIKVFVPKLKQIEKTITVTVTGTKDDFTSKTYTWTADSDEYVSVKKTLSANACAELFNYDIFTEAGSVCNTMALQLEHAKLINEDITKFEDECNTNYFFTYHNSCINYFHDHVFNDKLKDESKYRFYEISFLLSNNEDYAELISNMSDHEFIDTSSVYRSVEKLHTKLEEIPEIQPGNFDTNCQTFCQNLKDSEYYSEKVVQECNAICTSSCDQFCGKVHKNYAGADDAILLVYAYTDYLNQESTTTISKLTDKLLEEYSSDIAVYYGSNPSKFDPGRYSSVSLKINQLEYYAYQNQFGNDMHKFLIKYNPILLDLEFDEETSFINDFPLHAENLANLGDFDYFGRNNNKNFDEANNMNLQTLANVMGIRGKTPVLVINDKVIPVNQTTSYESIKSVLDTELARAKDISKQTGLKGVPLSNHIRSQMNNTNTGKTKVEFQLDQDQNDQKLVFIETGKAPTIGNKNAPVTFITFSEFQCPWCQKGNDTLKELQKNYPNDIRIVYKHAPLSESYHRYATIAAQAAVAAQNQNKFWPYGDKLYELVDEAKHNDYTKEEFVEHAITLAEELGMNKKKFIQDMNHPDTLKRIETERDLLQKTLNGNGVPTYYINGTKFTGAKPYDQFETAFKLELQKAKSFNSSAKGEALYKAIVNASSNDKDQKLTIDTTNDIHFGNPNAPITLVHFLDIQDVVGTLPTYNHTKFYLNSGADIYQIIYKPTEHFDETSMFYASLLIAASKQNFFMEMADFIARQFVDYSPWGSDDEIDIDDSLKRALEFVRESGRDEQRFLQDYNSDETKKQIKQNTLDYNLLKCKGKYTCFIVQDKVVPENNLDDAMDKAYEDYLNQKTQPNSVKK